MKSMSWVKVINIGIFQQAEMIYDTLQVFEAKLVSIEYCTEMQFLEQAKTAIILYRRLPKFRTAGEWMVLV